MSFCTASLWRRQSAHAAGLAMAGALMLASATAAIAAEAYIQNGAGAREKALAGAGVASSTDATAAGLNPAGLVNVGSQLNASVSFLNLDGGYTAPPVSVSTLPATHDSEPGWLPIPNLAVNWRVNWALVDAIAFTAYGNGGVSTHYKDIANPNCPIRPVGGVLRRPSRNYDDAELLLGGLRQGDIAAACRSALRPSLPISN